MAERIVERFVDYTVSAKDTTQAAFDSVVARVKGVQSAFEGVVNKIQSIGAAIGVTAFVGLMGQVAEFRGKLDDLQDSGLGSVETLSKISQATRLSGGDFDFTTAALGKMVKGLAGSEKETSMAGEALRRLGIDARDSSGALKAPGDVMLEVSKKFAGYKDNADKAAFAQAIFGKGGEKLLPVLKDMSEYGDLVAKVTGKQAAEADAYEKAVKRLEISLEGSKKKIAGDLIPVGTAFVQTLTDIIMGVKGVETAADKLARQKAVEEWALRGVEGVAVIVNGFDSLVRVVRLVGEGMGYTAAQLVEVGRAALGALQIMAGPAFWKDGMANIAKAAENIRGNAAAFQEVRTSILMAELAGDKLLVKFKQQYEVVKLLSQAAAGDFADQVSRRFAKAMERPTLNTKGMVPGATTQELTEAQKAYNALIDAMRQANTEGAKLRAQAANFDEYGNSIHGVAEAVARFEVEQGKFAIAKGEDVEQWKADFIARARSNDQLMEQIAGFKALKSALEASTRALAEYDQRGIDAVLALNIGFAESRQALEFEAAQIGKTREEVLRLTTARQIDLQVKKALEAISTDDGGMDAEKFDAIVAAAERAKSVLTNVAVANERNRTAFDDVVGLVREGNDAFKEFTVSILSGSSTAGDALRKLGQTLKTSVLDLLWKLIAQPFIINVVASLTGMNAAGLAQAAGMQSAGGSFLTSSLGGYAGSVASAAGVGSWFGAGTAGASGIPLAGAGTTMTAITEGIATGVNTMYSAIAEFASAIPVWGWVIAGVAALAIAFRDSGENWKARLGFGANANAYANTDVWGVREGFQNIAGDDRTNRAIQAVFKTFDKLDERIIKSLTDAQNAAVRTALENATSSREYAFPKGDETAAPQLIMQYLMDHFSTVFGAIPGLQKIADQVRDWSGSIEDLSKVIGEAIGVIELVASDTIQGLTIPILQEWAKENETLAQTAARVVQNFATFVDKFAPESFKLDLLVKPFTSAVQDLGVALPATRQGFFDYVQSLKLGDETQRKIYDEIMNKYLPAADAYYSAIEKQAEAAKQAGEAIRSALDSILTDSERMGQAQSLLASLGISNREQLIAWIAAIDPATEAGQRATGMLGQVTSAFNTVYGAVERLIIRVNGAVVGVRGETAAGAMPDSLLDQVKPVIEDIGDTIRDAFQTVMDYIDRARSQIDALKTRYVNVDDVAAAKASVASLSEQIAAFGLVVPPAGAEFTAWITSVATGLDATTPRGIVLANLLTQLADSMDVVTAAADNEIDIHDQMTATADPVRQFLDSLVTEAEQVARAQSDLSAFNIKATDSFEQVRSVLERLGLQGFLSAEALQQLYADWQRLHGLVDGSDPHSGIGNSDATTAAREYADQVRGVFDGLRTDADRFGAAQSKVQAAGLGANSTLEELEAELTRMAQRREPIENIQDLVAAWELLAQAEKKRRDSIQATIDSLQTADERLLSQQLTLASYGLANVSREYFMKTLDQMLEDGTSSETVAKIADAWKGVEAAAVQAADKARVALERIGDFRDSIASTIANTRKGQAGYDYGGYLAGVVTRAQTKLGDAVGIDAQLSAAAKLRDALASQYSFQMGALQQQQQLAAENAKAQADAMRELGSALKGVGDYARKMLSDDLSALSPTEKLAAAKSEYERLLALAPTDAKAAGDLTGAADLYRQLAQGYYGAGSGYAEIDAKIRGDLSPFIGKGDAMLTAAQNTAESASRLADVMTPQMIALQEDYIHQIELLDEQADAWEAEQRAALAAAEAQRTRMEGHQRDTATNTKNTEIAVAGLRGDIQTLAGVLTRLGGRQVELLDEGNGISVANGAKAERARVTADIASAQS